MRGNLEALVLNADMRPVTAFPLSTWNFETTVKNVFLGRVSVVEEYDVEMHSQREIYRPASVVMLRSYAKTPQVVPFNRENIFIRDGYCCQYCGKQFARDGLTFDHVVPRVNGGKTEWANIVAACYGCNSRKGHRTDIRPLMAPRQPGVQEMVRLKGLQARNLHRSWHDYLYWSGVLLPDDVPGANAPWPGHGKS